MFTQQTIKVVADHELDTWDYKFKDLTATVQFKSMKLVFLHTDLQGCKDFQSKLMNARAIFGSARIPADNLINALLEGGYKLVKTEVNRPSQTTIRNDPWSLAAMTNYDQRLMSDLHSTPLGGHTMSNQSYKFGDEYGPSVQLEHTQAVFDSYVNGGAPADAGVSGDAARSAYTITLSNPRKEGELEEEIMKAFHTLDMEKRGR
ncbi:hypothetical protein BN79_012 [Yersinia phage phiR2-01]|uniref:Uncharacterized protein n=1 Tax=Yersinia phage phiR2-01 TaxID=1206557 RepID=I7KQR7_9CAUD|nr:hypothetical protein BN79_012 [Yersinia phage phiR2-01]CCI88440.1 hypothetical protein BN79_012 [Yersinia phage phiR2-01]